MPIVPLNRQPGIAPVSPTLRAAAALLGLHPNTVRAQVRRRIIPGTKVGRDWRFLEADLVAWIRSGYPEAARVQLSALEREAIWHSTDVQASITSNSQARKEASLDAPLKPRTGEKRWKLYRETYGQAEPVQEPIPAMLASFLEGDRAFVRRRRERGS